MFVNIPKWAFKYLCILTSNSTAEREYFLKWIKLKKGKELIKPKHFQSYIMYKKTIPVNIEQI